MDAIHTHVFQTRHKGRHVIVVEARIHASHTIDIALEHTVLDDARIFQGGLELVGATQRSSAVMAVTSFMVLAGRIN